MSRGVSPMTTTWSAANGTPMRAWARRRGERGELGAVVVIRAVGAKTKVRQKSRRLQLDSRSRLDIPREQA
jgi:hypothetical protein